MFLMKSAEAMDSWMFSGRENCWRIPPADSAVEAREYCRRSEEGKQLVSRQQQEDMSSSSVWGACRCLQSNQASRPRGRRLLSFYISSSCVCSLCISEVSHLWSCTLFSSNCIHSSSSFSMTLETFWTSFFTLYLALPLLLYFISLQAFSVSLLILFCDFYSFWEFFCFLLSTKMYKRPITWILNKNTKTKNKKCIRKYLGHPKACKLEYIVN